MSKVAGSNRKITLLGERPGPQTDPRRPLFPHTTTGAAANLARMMGMTIEQYLEETDRFNASDAALGYESTGAMIPRDRVARILNGLRESDDYELLIVLGRETQRALPLPWRAELEYNEPVYVSPGNTTILLIPHTSGRNRMFNDKEFLRETEKIIRHEVALWRLGRAPQRTSSGTIRDLF